MNMIHRKNMRIRDPFLVTDRENHCYYLVMNGGTVEDKHPNDAVFLRKTEDLIHFEDPFPILRLDMPAKGQCWAPEIHFYKGAWYLFTTVTKTMKGSGVDTGTLPFEETRGTAIFRSDSLTGPYEKWSDGPLTPPEPSSWIKAADPGWSIATNGSKSTMELWRPFPLRRI